MNHIMQQNVFCEWLLKNMYVRFVDTQLLFITYEAWFYLVVMSINKMKDMKQQTSTCHSASAIREYSGGGVVHLSA